MPATWTARGEEGQRRFDPVREKPREDVPCPNARYRKGTQKKQLGIAPKVAKGSVKDVLSEGQEKLNEESQGCSKRHRNLSAGGTVESLLSETKGKLRHWGRGNKARPPVEGIRRNLSVLY